MMELTVAPILVAYHTYPWIKVAIGSYRKHFSGELLLVVDNNPTRTEPGWTLNCELERHWLRDQSDVVLITNNTRERSHGHGMDIAMEHCRTAGADVMLSFEPDCLISGNRWRELLLEPIRNGAWMSGSLRRFYGPISATPSIWRTDIEWSSFAYRRRGSDVHHPQFNELFKLDDLLRWSAEHEPQAVSWWRDYWDTTQRNWFQAASENRAALVEATSDFTHYWYGSKRPPDLADERLSAYLHEPDPTPADSSRQKPVDNLALQRLIYEHASDMVTPDELLELASVIARRPWSHGEYICEIGTFHGHTAAFLGRVCDLFGVEASVLSIDPFEGATPEPKNGIGSEAAYQATLDRFGQRPRCKSLKGDSAAVASEAPSNIGLLFIDGSHRYEAVRNDILLYTPKLAPGGVVVIDDWWYHYPGVMKAAQELLAPPSFELRSEGIKWKSFVRRG